MSLSTFFGFKSSESIDNELEELFPLSVAHDIFVSTDVMSTYSKILTDCVERTQGFTEETFPLLWDNCLQSESAHGLISILSCAMAYKKDLFLIYNPTLSLVREATGDEASLIKLDYETKGSSELGIYVSFKKYHRTDMVTLYTSMEYCVISSLNKMTNLSKAIQFKMNDLRGSVSLIDSGIAINQAKGVARSLKNGRDILIDKNDDIVTNAPDISAIKESILFLDSKKCFYYGMPLSYISGEQTGGIGSTGEADTKAVERGLKQYFISILKPVCEALFGITLTFKTADFRQIGSALEAIKTFELVGNEFLSLEDKQLIIQKLFDLEQA